MLVYVPMLAYKIIQYNQNADARAKINLKGILVGNGVADWNYDTDKAMTNFAFTHHLTSYEHRLKYNKYCVLEYDKTECDKLLEQMEGWLKFTTMRDTKNRIWRRRLFLKLLFKSTLGFS